MTALGSGNVGIGTTSPGKNLEINDSSVPTIRFARDNSYYWDIGHTSSQFQFNSQTGSTIMQLNYDGNVGIGTTSPGSPLDIVTNLSSDTTTSPDTVLTIATKYASTGSNGGAGAGPRLEFQIPDDETNPITGAAIAGIKEAADDSDASAGMAFYISQNDTTLDEAVRIDHDGNVGIGITSPDNTLHIHKGTAGSVTGNTNAPLTVENSTSNFLQMLAPNANESGILFGNPTNSANAGIVYSGLDGDLQFRNAGNTSRMKIDSSGTVSYTHLTLPTNREV